ncbi:MAG: DinB family protein [Planctomycetota bacterium]
MTPADGFDLGEGRALLANTPALLTGWLTGLPEPWLAVDEGPGTWNAYAVLGHLVEGERNDWIPRVRWLLAHGTAAAFPPFDREAQFARAPRPMAQLLAEFAAVRAQNLAALDAFAFTPDDLARQGRHPAFGVVTLGQHLATWVAHDLTHVTQIARVMARRLAAAVGPWREYLRVVRS